MRASRLVSLLLLLQSRRQLTAPELAEELEVSVRTIYRDVEALSAAGVPVYAEAGRGGGFRLVEGYRTRLTGLSAREAEALLIGGTPGPVGELGLGTVFAAAQAKLLAALPEDVADRAFVVRQRFHLDATGWFRPSHVPAYLGPVATAVWEGHRLEIDYHHVDADEDARRVLDPFGLVLKAGVWYLVAGRDGETRTYRVSRIRSARALPQDATRPPDFDLARYWAEAVARFEVGATKVVVTLQATDRAIAALRQRGYDVGPIGPHDSSETASTAVSFEDLDSAAREVMALGGAAEVVEPTELRERVARTARELTGVYDRQPSGATHRSTGPTRAPGLPR